MGYQKTRGTIQRWLNLLGEPNHSGDTRCPLRWKTHPRWRLASRMRISSVDGGVAAPDAAQRSAISTTRDLLACGETWACPCVCVLVRDPPGSPVLIYYLYPNDLLSTVLAQRCPFYSHFSVHPSPTPPSALPRRNSKHDATMAYTPYTFLYDYR